MSLSRNKFTNGQILTAQDMNDIVDAIVNNENELNGKINVQQGGANAGKALIVNSQGYVSLGDAGPKLDESLSTKGRAADAKAVGDQLTQKASATLVAALAVNLGNAEVDIDDLQSDKLDKNLGANNSGKVLLVGSDGNVSLGGTDKTLSIEGKIADAKTVGDRIAELWNYVSFSEIVLSNVYIGSEASTAKSTSYTVEMGQSVPSVYLSWTLSKNPLSIVVDSNPTDVANRNITITGPFTASKQFTVSVTDRRSEDEDVITKSANVNLYVYNGVYYGVSSTTAVNAALINSLTKTLTNTKARTFTANAGNGQYIYYCLPSRLGTPAFNVGGFDGGFSNVGTVSFKNASNYTENYTVWRSDNTNLGNTSVKVV